MIYLQEAVCWTSCQPTRRDSKQNIAKLEQGETASIEGASKSTDIGIEVKQALRGSANNGIHTRRCQGRGQDAGRGRARAPLMPLRPSEAQRLVSEGIASACDVLFLSDWSDSVLDGSLHAF